MLCWNLSDGAHTACVACRTDGSYTAEVSPLNALNVQVTLEDANSARMLLPAGALQRAELVTRYWAAIGVRCHSYRNHDCIKVSLLSKPSTKSLNP